MTKSRVLSWVHACLTFVDQFVLLSKSHTVTQTWLLWWYIFPAGLSSPAQSSPPLPPVWQVPAQDWPASAHLSHGLNAGLWSGGELAFPRAGRNGAYHRSDAALRPWTWHVELKGWTRRPGNGRRTSLGPGNMPCCPPDRGCVHSDCGSKKWTLGSWHTRHVECQKVKWMLTWVMFWHMLHEWFLGTPHGDTGNHHVCWHTFDPLCSCFVWLHIHQYLWANVRMRLSHSIDFLNSNYILCDVEQCWGEVNTFTATAITGQIITCRTGAAVAARCVNTGVQTQSPSLAIMEQLTFIDIWKDEHSFNIMS